MNNCLKLNNELRDKHIFNFIIHNRVEYLSIEQIKQIEKFIKKIYKDIILKSNINISIEDIFNNNLNIIEDIELKKFLNAIPNKIHIKVPFSINLDKLIENKFNIDILQEFKLHEVYSNVLEYGNKIIKDINKEEVKIIDSLMNIREKLKDHKYKNFMYKFIGNIVNIISKVITNKYYLIKDTIEIIRINDNCTNIIHNIGKTFKKNKLECIKQTKYIKNIFTKAKIIKLYNYEGIEIYKLPDLRKVSSNKIYNDILSTCFLMTTGLSIPIIFLHEDVNNLTENEKMVILLHEIGHIKNGHSHFKLDLILYHTYLTKTTTDIEKYETSIKNEITADEYVFKRLGKDVLIDVLTKFRLHSRNKIYIAQLKERIKYFKD